MATKDKIVNLEDLKAVHDIDAAEISGLKSALNSVENKTGSTTQFEPVKTTEAKAINISGGVISYVDASTISTAIISVVPGDNVTYKRTGQSLTNTCFFDSNKIPIQGSNFTPPATTDNTVIAPDGSAYVGFSGTTARLSGLVVTIARTTKGSLLTEIEKKVSINQGQENAGKTLVIDQDGNITPATVEMSATSGSDNIPLFVSMMPDFFWVSTNEIAAFSASLAKYKEGTSKADNNAWFQISGNQGDDFVTIIQGGNGDIADITETEREKPFGCVIMYDDGNYYPCNAQYLSDTTFSVWPPLKANITSGELAQIRTGIHLSRRGYRAYSQHLYKAEPKHCEKSQYIARWRKEDDTIPWTFFGAPYTHQVMHNNLSTNFIDRLYQDAYTINKAQSHDTSNTDTGISWNVDVSGKTGYVEFYIGIRLGAGTLYELDSADAIHCELWLDGVKAAHYDKTIKRLERVCFDFSGAESAELKIYGSRWQTTDVGFGFVLNRITWWVNKRYATTGEKLFPSGAVVGQLYDSWGEFHDAESAVYLKKEIDKDLEVAVPYYNGSLSDQTSAWGKAWFYNKIWENHPAIMITNFGINDTITASGTSSLPSTITGPDGTVYDNIIGTVEEYSANMETIKKEALANGIVPIFVGVGLNVYQTYPNGYIDTQAILT